MIQWSIVYTVTNRKNQKVYVGIHRTEDHEWPRGVDRYRPSVVAVNNDVSLYGAEHFHITVIHCAPTADEANRIYNSTLNAHRGNSYNDDISESIAVAHRGKPKEGTPHTKETKQNFRSGIRARENNGFYNKNHSEENIERIRAYRKSQRWAVNPLARNEIVIAKDAPLPPGYIEGRLCKGKRTAPKQLKKYKELMGLSND